MKITLFIGGLGGGGAERVMCNLANYLARQGDDVEIITMTDEPAEYAPDDAVRRVCLIKAAERKNVAADMAVRVKRLRRYLRREERDCYLVMLPVTICMMLLLRGNTKARVVVSERGDPARLSGAIRFIFRHFAKRADGYVFQTEDAKRWYGDAVRDSVVIPNAINEAFLRPAYEGERKKTVVAAGRLSAQKNFELLIRAFAQVASDFPAYRLVIYGEGDRKAALSALAGELGVADRVELPGHVSGIGDKITDAGVFVLSSDFEGMPNALMEAMALGLPCISTDCPVGGPRFLIENGKNGLLTPVGDESALAAALRRVLDDPAGAAEMGKAAEEIKTRLHPDRIYAQWRQYLAAGIEDD